MSPWLGVVADDVTGAVDLAGEVTAAGLSTVVVLGRRDGALPEDPLPASDCAVVALTTRTAPAERAVRESVDAARRLLADGTTWLYQKYCSTFDSTDEGNIGPVADALADLVGGATVGTPATPAVGRTQYLGHLFVAGRLLSESSLRHHPLTPMRDPDLVRVLGRQTTRPVALLPLTELRQDAGAVHEQLTALLTDGAGHVLVDAVDDADLDLLAHGLLREDRSSRPDAPHRLVATGAAGLATALARTRAGHAGPSGRTGTPTAVPPTGPGPCLIISGSCSDRTREQVAAHAGPRLRISAPELAADAAGTVDRAVRAVVEAWEASSIPLVYSTADAERVRAEQEEVGRDRAARLVEHALGEVARRAVHDHGARRLIVAGGESSGAVMSALGVDTLHVGPRVEAGLPWTVTADEPHLALLLKSGNFGRPDLFAVAWETCP